MGAEHSSLSAADIAAAFDWWKLAGADVHVVDEASGWLDGETGTSPQHATAQPQAKAPPPKPKPPAPAPHAALPGLSPVGSETDTWPTELAEFQRWWVEDENFAAQGAFPRIAPRGSADSELLVLLPQPEETDGDRLFSGPQGALLNGFLRAAGLDEEQVYFASILPRHTLRPDWSEVEAAGYGRLAAHHVALAAPKRLIVFGRDILSLLPHESAQDSANLRIFNHESGSIPLLPARDVANLGRRPGFRARFWQQWLDFSGS
ncbi:uracil-DNA glycosylase family protein [Erythrobacter litoralis]|uniref:Uracil-DNA glycosylase-like domain-containing protein n=1 Tax=Erythrobacter litoralis (strain HTCC2594) TaxID=314225 RepID=Q2NA12_ERYLH|nr:uracil-DNA glycosylase family protein [Erythrobacter litoralis]ABC63479.1 hypothetical protein ELI_06935 [Erythrobacter litoralis HTCC2594]